MPYEEAQTRLQHLMVAHKHVLNCIDQPVADTGAGLLLGSVS
jgi:hypothetical protein